VPGPGPGHPRPSGMNRNDETPAELRARAARVRSHAWEFVDSTMRLMLFQFADELDAKAEAMTADQCSGAGRPCWQ
jgi:hypothetical protein